MDDETTRLYLQSSLEALFPNLAVYFSPDGNRILERPCIVYEPKELQPSYANSSVYVVGTQYQVTILSDNPGYISPSTMFGLVTDGVVVERATRFVVSDIVHNVFTVSVNSI